MSSTKPCGRDPSSGKDNRLTAAGYSWAFAALTALPGARAHYDRPATPETGAPPPTQPVARLLGSLHHCLATAQHYDEPTAFPRHALSQLDE